jgi:hypothetical protein
MPYKNEPYYPQRRVTYGSLFFYIRGRTFNINPFNPESIKEAKQIILREARDASPSYKMFIKAAMAATKLSETTIKRLLYEKDPESNV